MGIGSSFFEAPPQGVSCFLFCLTGLDFLDFLDFFLDFLDF